MGGCPEEGDEDGGDDGAGDEGHAGAGGAWLAPREDANPLALELGASLTRPYAGVSNVLFGYARGPDFGSIWRASRVGG